MDTCRLPRFIGQGSYFRIHKAGKKVYNRLSGLKSACLSNKECYNGTAEDDGLHQYLRSRKATRLAGIFFTTGLAPVQLNSTTAANPSRESKTIVSVPVTPPLPPASPTSSFSPLVVGLLLACAGGAAFLYNWIMQLREQRRQADILTEVPESDRTMEAGVQETPAPAAVVPSTSTSLEAGNEAAASGGAVAAASGVAVARPVDMVGGALKESQKRVALMQAMVEALRGRLEAEEARSTELKAHIASLTSELETAEAGRSEAGEDASLKASALAEARKALASSQANASVLASRASELAGYVTRLESRLVALEAALVKQAAAAEAAARGAQAREASLEASVAAGQAALQEAAQALAAKEKELTQLRAVAQRGRVAVEKMADKLRKSGSELQQKSSELEDLKRQMTNNVSAADAQVAAKEAEVMTALQEVKRLKEELEAEKKNAEVGNAAAQQAAAGELGEARLEAERYRAEVASLRSGIANLLCDEAVGSGTLGKEGDSRAQAIELLAELSGELVRDIGSHMEELGQLGDAVEARLAGKDGAELKAARRARDMNAAALSAAQSGGALTTVVQWQAALVASDSRLSELRFAAMTRDERARERALMELLTSKQKQLKTATVMLTELKKRQQEAAEQTLSGADELLVRARARIQELLQQQRTVSEAAQAARERELQVDMSAREERHAEELAALRAQVTARDEAVASVVAEREAAHRQEVEEAWRRQRAEREAWERETQVVFEARIIALEAALRRQLAASTVAPGTPATPATTVSPLLQGLPIRVPSGQMDSTAASRLLPSADVRGQLVEVEQLRAELTAAQAALANVQLVSERRAASIAADEAETRIRQLSEASRPSPSSSSVPPTSVVQQQQGSSSSSSRDTSYLTKNPWERQPNSGVVPTTLTGGTSASPLLPKLTSPTSSTSNTLPSPTSSSSNASSSSSTSGGVTRNSPPAVTPTLPVSSPLVLPIKPPTVELPSSSSEPPKQSKAADASATRLTSAPVESLVTNAQLPLAAVPPVVKPATVAVNPAATPISTLSSKPALPATPASSQSTPPAASQDSPVLPTLPPPAFEPLTPLRATPASTPDAKSVNGAKAEGPSPSSAGATQLPMKKAPEGGSGGSAGVSSRPGASPAVQQQPSQVAAVRNLALPQVNTPQQNTAPFRPMPSSPTSPPASRQAQSPVAPKAMGTVVAPQLEQSSSEAAEMSRLRSIMSQQMESAIGSAAAVAVVPSKTATSVIAAPATDMTPEETTVKPAFKTAALEIKSEIETATAASAALAATAVENPSQVDAKHADVSVIPSLPEHQPVAETSAPTSTAPDSSSSVLPTGLALPSSTLPPVIDQKPLSVTDDSIGSSSSSNLLSGVSSTSVSRDSSTLSHQTSSSQNGVMEVAEEQSSRASTEAGTSSTPVLDLGTAESTSSITSKETEEKEVQNLKSTLPTPSTSTLSDMNITATTKPQTQAPPPRPPSLPISSWGRSIKTSEDASATDRLRSEPSIPSPPEATSATSAAHTPSSVASSESLGAGTLPQTDAPIPSKLGTAAAAPSASTLTSSSPSSSAISHQQATSTADALKSAEAPSSSARSIFPSEQELSDEIATLASSILMRSSQAVVPTLRPAAASTRPGEKTLNLTIGAHMIPHPDKADKGGEDAWFAVTPRTRSSGSSANGVGGYLGVADGVGGWAEDGIDPAEYSRGIMRACEEALSKDQDISLRDALHDAQQCVDVPGSCTVVLAGLRPKRMMEVLILGDAGLKLLRGSKVVYSSRIQEHDFNMPYQMASPAILPETDTPDDALRDEVSVTPGDIVIAGSDGLFDNLFDSEILSISAAWAAQNQWPALSAQESQPSSSYLAASAADLAKRLATAGHQAARNPMAKTPWATECAATGRGSLLWRLSPRGGKMDDITVVVGLIS